MAFGNVAWVAGMFYAIKPAVTAIVLQAAHRIGSCVLKNKALWGIAAASWVAIFALQLPFPLIVLAPALLGYAGGRWAPPCSTARTGTAVPPGITAPRRLTTTPRHPSMRAFGGLACLPSRCTARTEGKAARP